MDKLRDIARKYAPGPLRKVLSGIRHDRLGTSTPNRYLEADALVAAGTPIAEAHLGDLSMLVDLRDMGVGRRMFVEGEYEASEVRFLQRTVRPGDTFIDVGANIGYFSVMGSRLVGPQGRVIAFEPHPGNRGLLVQNVSRQALQNVTVDGRAVGDSSGTITMHCSLINHGDHRTYAAQEAGEAQRTTIEVDMVSLDDAIDDHVRPNVIKIDVQGYEPQVLAGARRTIGRCDDLTILMEYWPYGVKSAGGDAQAMLSPLMDASLRPFLLQDDGTIVPTSLEALAVLPQLNPSVPWSERWVNLVFRRDG